MKIFLALFGIVFTVFSWTTPVTFAQENNDAIKNLHYDLSTKEGENAVISSFSDEFGHFYKTESNHGEDIIQNSFFQIAKGIKNFFIFIAACFLVFHVIKLFFSEASDDDVKKWKNSIVWTSIGIVFMQMAFGMWQTAMSLGGTNYGTNPITAAAAWEFWHKIFAPIVGLLQFGASFAFFAVLIYAFYIIVTGAGDEEKLKKWKNALIFGVVGFVMIQLPYRLVNALYKGLPQCENPKWIWTLADAGCNQVNNGSLTDAVSLFGQIIIYFNRFLTVLCILMAIYAGWLLFISAGDEEKVKKAKNIIIYIAIGLILLVASHAIFRFFILEGMTK